MDLTSSAVVKEVRWWWGWVYQPVLGNGVDQLRSKVLSTTVLIVGGSPAALTVGQLCIRLALVHMDDYPS